MVVCATPQKKERTTSELEGEKEAKRERREGRNSLTLMPEYNSNWFEFWALDKIKANFWIFTASSHLMQTMKKKRYTSTIETQPHRESERKRDEKAVSTGDYNSKITVFWHRHKVSSNLFTNFEVILVVPNCFLRHFFFAIGVWKKLIYDFTSNVIFCDNSE